MLGRAEDFPLGCLDPRPCERNPTIIHHHSRLFEEYLTLQESQEGLKGPGLLFECL